MYINYVLLSIDVYLCVWFGIDLYCINIINIDVNCIIFFVLTEKIYL